MKKCKHIVRFLFLGTVMIELLTACSKENLRIALASENTETPILHGLEQLKKLEEGGLVHFDLNNPDYSLHTKIDSLQYQSEAYEIIIDGRDVNIIGGDAVGVMYGILDVKEQLETNGRKIIAKKESPILAFRAIKFNLPWDSYRFSAVQMQHIQTCRDTVFWRDFLDMMTENRFNKLTLWNLHPFNFMVKTEKYPEASSFSDAELADWQQFWHTLFKMAKDRGIETYLINWNIFVPLELSKAHNLNTHMRETNAYLGEGDTSEIVKDYMREVVRTTIDTYPNLTGLGITLGEGMGGMSAKEREQWLLDSFIEGVRHAKRKIKFIHRVPLSAGTGSGGSTSASVEQMTRNTLDTLTCFDGPINIELKFNWSHAHSTTKLVKVHGGKLTDTYWNPLPENYYLAWMMRNEDFFILRWGQPDFIREHINENVYPYVNGYYVGSETYIPAKDYITSLPGASYKYAFERQWMFYKTWGRLLYNPKTPDSFFVNAFENRFPTYGQQLFDGQKKASLIPLIIASYWNAKWDFTLYSEGMLGFNEGPPVVKLLSLSTLCNKEPMDPSYMSVKEYLQEERNTGAHITPIELADSIDSFCMKALYDVEKIDPKENIDLLYEVSDIKAWSYLGMYFSNKLRAAVSYQKFLNTADAEDFNQAVGWLEKATDHWKNLVTVTTPVYKPVPLIHKGYNGGDEIFHWSIVQQEVEDELEWLKNQLK